MEKKRIVWDRNDGNIEYQNEQETGQWISHMKAMAPL